MNFARVFLVLAIAASLAGADAQESPKAPESKPTPQVHLGRLGQALEATPIKASPTTSSRTFYKVKPYEYLVVENSKYSGWKRVLLQNGRYGYIKTSVVAELPYEVTADAPSSSRATGTPTSRSAGMYLVSRGLQFKDAGVRYKWGGTDPTSGIDCSAFVKQLFGEIGLKLPRTAAEQALVGMPINRLEDLQAGDRLYFWSSSRSKIGHTGIYMGNGYFVHSSSGKGKVSTDYLGSAKWLKILVAARR